MKTKQLIFTPADGWKETGSDSLEINPQLILIFGATALIESGTPASILKENYPKAAFMGGSSAGEISGINVLDNTLVATLVEFKNSAIKYVKKHIETADDSYNAGQFLINELKSDELKHVFIISEGLHVNGSELVRGIRDTLPQHISATGGLAGDGASFNKTYILDNDGKPLNKAISAMGFYGNNLNISYGSMGGWDSFGVERLVTRSKNNILYELDGSPALQLYKSFLGEYAKDLPASGLLFPLNLRSDKTSDPVVRTILSVDEENQSLTFAGDIPEGSYVRLMKANFDRLIDGAINAAKGTLSSQHGNNAELAVLISCVGRKLVLKQMIEEEVEGVREVLGDQAVLCGFYSYGEISPFSADAKCELHNQTMTITTFSES